MPAPLFDDYVSYAIGAPYASTTTTVDGTAYRFNILSALVIRDDINSYWLADAIDDLLYGDFIGQFPTGTNAEYYAWIDTIGYDAYNVDTAWAGLGNVPSGAELPDSTGILGNYIGLSSGDFTYTPNGDAFRLFLIAASVPNTLYDWLTAAGNFITPSLHATQPLTNAGYFGQATGPGDAREYRYRNGAGFDDAVSWVTVNFDDSANLPGITSSQVLSHLSYPGGPVDIVCSHQFNRIDMFDGRAFTLAYAAWKHPFGPPPPPASAGPVGKLVRMVNYTWPATRPVEAPAAPAAPFIEME